MRVKFEGEIASAITQQARKRDVKMKVIDKTKTTKIHQINSNIGSAGFTSNNLEPLQLPLKNGDIEIIQPTFLKLTELFLEKDTIHITTKNNEICDIVLEDKDKLQLFKDYLGQEEFRQNELTSLRKKVDAISKLYDSEYQSLFKVVDIRGRLGAILGKGETPIGEDPH